MKDSYYLELILMKPKRELSLKFTIFGIQFKITLSKALKPRNIFEQPSPCELSKRLCFPIPPYTDSDIIKYRHMLQEYQDLSRQLEEQVALSGETRNRHVKIGTFSDYN
jgi:hypothetical protein